MSSSTHIDNKKKEILVLGKGPTQGLQHTLTAEEMYSINFTVINKKICLSLHYNGANIYLFINRQKFTNSNSNSEIVATPLCSGNISRNWSVDNMKKCYVYDFYLHFYVYKLTLKIELIIFTMTLLILKVLNQTC